jgi:hypothetical protein
MKSEGIETSLFLVLEDVLFYTHLQVWFCREEFLYWHGSKDFFISKSNPNFYSVFRQMACIDMIFSKSIAVKSFSFFRRIVNRTTPTCSVYTQRAKRTLSTKWRRKVCRSLFPLINFHFYHIVFLYPMDITYYINSNYYTVYFYATHNVKNVTWRNVQPLFDCDVTNKRQFYIVCSQSYSYATL